MKNQYLSILFVILVLAGSVFMSGCTSSGEESVASGQTLVLGEMWDIDGIDPAVEGTVIGEKAAVTETLVGANSDFSLKPELAESWEQTDDYTWVFTLRQGVKFHDGSTMTAEDVKFSLERTIAENTRVESMLKIDSINVIGDHTLEITTTDLNPILAGILHYPDLGIISASSFNENGEFVKPIGTGPYVFESYDEQTRVLTVVKNDEWWGGEVGLEKMILKGMPDPNTRAMAIENGELDFTVDVPYSETDHIDSIEGIIVEKYSTPRVYKMDTNLQNEALADVRVRQAISYAINRDDIVEHVLYNVGEPAAGPFLPVMAWTNKDLKPYDQDLEKAKELLTEAGWVDTDGDGIRDKDGEALEFELLTYSARPGLPPMAEAIAAQLKDVGISVSPQVLEWGAISDKQKNGDWELLLAAYNIAMVPDPEYVLSNWYTTTGPDNGPGYSNPEVDALVEEARTIKDLDLRYQKFNEVEAIVYEEQPMILVAYYGCAIVKKDSVKGYVFDPTAHDYRINAAMYMEE
ncbi:peptide/nickel transport system substrate-binding protein [Methanohalophilus levihalophilus]|uniref:ABC transporter substrate-binding protein n=1 Tax=Methanohalophilus levihalophilus TaxID=1431282 RepID=UPI001AE56453|nr:ABC transporter substrate-binding protein [Methanohalophilus levihalophilus]MBP2030786.1 peptide/nickel transport system substrate-binding protein [Methanohalophilus levihalophilus]